MGEPVKYDLLLTNQRRVRWLWWGILLYVSGLVGLITMRFVPGFWLLMALPLTLWIIPLFFDKLFRQASWVLLAADSIAWANPTDSSSVSWQFAEIRSYRFLPSRNGVGLLLYLTSGEKAGINASFNEEFIAFWNAFDQTIRRYNQANPSAEVVKEKDGLTKFFEQAIATKVLYGLLLAGGGLVGWGITHGWGPVPYVILGFLLLAYLAIWANFYNQRT